MQRQEKESHGERPRRVIPLTKWNEYHTYPSVGGLRHLVFNAESNGFDAVIRRCGRRVLIDEQAFFEFLDRQSRGSEKGGRNA